MPRLPLTLLLLAVTVPLVAAVRTVPVAETRYVEVGGKAHPADKVALRFSYEDVGD